MVDDHGQVSLERGTFLGRGPHEAEPPWVRNPSARRHEWRRLFSEVLGTFLLVVVAAGAPVVDAVSHGRVPLDAQVVAPGLMVMAIIYFMGMVSGAHLNPAVTLSFAVRGNFPWGRVPGYILAQLIGATAASLLLRALFGTVGHLGATLPGPGISSGTAFLIETLLTFGLISVILGTASGARNVGANAALAVGGYIALAGLWAAPISGASMNPARSFGPQLVTDDWTSWWAYVAGPVAGGLLAVAVAWILRGPPSLAANIVAQGEALGGNLPESRAPGADRSSSRDN
ncbi:MAG TPA: aquaporin [Acidimicrobiales bacterium]|nr:aquaporin [Acidimicrobiales bacterium]